MAAIRRNMAKQNMTPDEVDAIVRGFGGAKRQRDMYRMTYMHKKEPQAPETTNTSKQINGLPRIVADEMCHKYTTFGLTPEMIDTIQSLVACPENGSSNWPLFLNYIEYGDDASIRGYTATLFGACSGTGDLYKVFKNLQRVNPDHPLCRYIPALKNTRRGDLTGIEGLAHVHGDPTKAKADWSKWTSNGRTHLDHIEGDLARLPLDDEDWARAVWMTYDQEYWTSAADFCLKRGSCRDRPGPVLTTPLAFGLMVDTSLNHGPAWYWKEEETWQRIFNKMHHANGDVEACDWLKDFLQARRRVLRSGFMGLDWSTSGDRCSIWNDLLDEGNWTLKRPIHIATSSKNIWPKHLVLT